MNAKHVISSFIKESVDINARHDIVVNILLNNILIQRCLIVNEQRLEDSRTVRRTNDEIMIGTEHWRSDEWKEKGFVS